MTRLHTPRRWSPRQVTAAPATTGVYGPAIGGDALANYRAGKMSSSGTKKHGVRFKAAASSNLVTVTFYFLSAQSPGYGGGTGGTWKLELFAVDANGLPTGSALASQSVAASTTNDPDKQVTFGTPYSVTSGTRYVLVFENTDADAETNYFSTDHWWYGGGTAAYWAALRRQPSITNDDWAVLACSYPAGVWSEATVGGSPGLTPILDIEYASGVHQGMSYGEANTASGEQGEITGASKMVRERFTVTGGDKVVTGFGVRLYRIAGGTDALTVGLYATSGDTLIDSFTIPAASIGTGSAPVAGSVTNSYAGRWVEGSFSAQRTLTNGTGYYVRLSTGSGTTYWAWVQRRLEASYLYTTSTAFTDGYAEKTTDGSAWSSLGRVSGENDLQCYLATVTA